VTLDEAFVKALVEDYEHAPLAPADRVMLDYVGQLTRDATRITPAHHRRLREAGFDDRGILQITLIASWFNYINRVADALGVGRGPAEG
jgi:alkylhydroperoxidase family enzyme